MGLPETWTSIQQRWEIALLRLRRPIHPPEAMQTLPDPMVGPQRLVSIERYMLETERAFYELLDLVNFERTMIKRQTKLSPSEHLCKQLDRDFAAFAKVFTRSTELFEREFMTFCPADQRMRPFVEAKRQYFANARYWVYYGCAVRMYSERGDLVQQRAFENKYIESRDVHRLICIELHKQFKLLRSSHPEFVENAGIPEEWYENLGIRERQRAFDFNPE